MSRKLFDALADAMKVPGKVALMEAGLKISAAQAKPKTREIIHMVGEQPVRLEIDGADVHTRCGIVGAPVSAGTKASPHRYTLIDSKGNQFFGTTLRSTVSCKKCSNLITNGKIHGQRS